MDFHSQKAIFLQIADLLSDGILQNKWSSNERIPSVRELAASIEVNPNTVMRAYTFLQDQEIISNKRGIGFFVLSDAVQKIKCLKKEEFISIEIPKIYKSMKMLDISLDDLDQMLKNFQE